MGSLGLVDDPRSHWEKFRRRELYAICKLEGIVFNPGCPATSIIQLLRDFNIDTNKYRPQAVPLSIPGEERIVIDKKIFEEKPNLEAMKMAELRKHCTTHGIKWNVKDKKMELIEKLNGQNTT